PPVSGRTVLASGTLLALALFIHFSRSPSTLTAIDGIEMKQNLEEKVGTSQSRLYGKDVSGVEDAKPNVIFILIDDMGWDDIGYQSSDLSNMTPTLDAMAAKGVKLSNYYSENVCTPARAALMTGRHTHRYGMQLKYIMNPAPWGLPLDEVTVANRFKGAGYQTHMVGKWHLGFYAEDFLPSNRGFDTFLGFLGGDETYVTHEWCDKYGRGCFTDFGYGDKNGYIDKETNTPCLSSDYDGVHSATAYVDAALEATTRSLEEAAAAGVEPDPMFLFFSSQAPHNPLESPDNSSFTEEDLYQLDLAVDGSVNSDRRTFAEMLYFMDKEIGRMMTRLGELGVLDDAIVVVASDNGACPNAGGSNFPLRGTKHSYFEGGLHVPAFVFSESRMPTQVQGTTYDGLMHVTDWVTTLAGPAGLPLDGNELDGVDHWNALSGVSRGAPMRTEIMLGYEDYEFDEDLQQTIRVDPRGGFIWGDWKVIVQDWCVSHYTQNDFSEVPTGLCSDDNGECFSCEGCYGRMDCTETNFLFNLKNDPQELVRQNGILFTPTSFPPLGHQSCPSSPLCWPQPAELLSPLTLICPNKPRLLSWHESSGVLS
ncbi:unnamed protein product, partial [Discosporangium mesarthrocarpum]